MPEIDDRCRRFAEIFSRLLGFSSYGQATKDFPRGPERNTCYLADGMTYISGHCVHCARVEAMGKAEAERPGSPQVIARYASNPEVV